MVGDIRACRIDIAVSRSGKMNHRNICVGDIETVFVHHRAGEERDIVAVRLDIDSVLLEDELALENPSTLPPSDIMADSKLNLVLVLGSKNRVASCL